MHGQQNIKKNYNVEYFNVHSVGTQSNYWTLKRKVHDGYLEHGEMNNRCNGPTRDSTKQTQAAISLPHDTNRKAVFPAR